MNNGFVILGDDLTSLRNACACAYSIKSEMPTASVTLIVPDLEQDHSRYDEPFDYSIATLAQAAKHTAQGRPS